MNGLELSRAQAALALNDIESAERHFISNLRYTNLFVAFVGFVAAAAEYGAGGNGAAAVIAAALGMVGIWRVGSSTRKALKKIASARILLAQPGSTAEIFYDLIIAVDTQTLCISRARIEDRDDPLLTPARVVDDKTIDR
jgi:uncharacterized membrane protein YjjP (DUF1212 family)